MVELTSRHFDIANLHQQMNHIEVVLGERLKALHFNRSSCMADAGETYRQVHDYTMRPSKRLRPLLFQLTRQACATQAPTDDAIAKACIAALEIAHSAILIHDDVIDGDQARSGVPALAVALQGTFTPSDAVSAAIMTGDCLFAAAVLEILRASLVYDSVKVKLCDLLLECTMRTSEGQIDELHTLQQPLTALTTAGVEAAYIAKTNPTSAELPLLMGAIAAAAPSIVTTTLRAASPFIGLGLQVMNDLVSYRVAKASPDQAFDPRSMTLAFCYMYEASPSEKLQKLFDAQRPTFSELAELADVDVTEKLLDRRVEELFMQAQQQLTMIRSTPLRTRLEEIFSFLKELYTPGTTYWNDLGRYKKV